MDDAINIWNKLFKKYPNNSNAHKGLYHTAEVYINYKNQFDKAIKILKKIRLYPWRKKARNKLSILKKKSLHLETKKLFTSKEKPYINVKLRNIKNFNVNIYRINLEEYFKRHHSLKKIHNLDILLIKPDKSLIHKIKDYQKYKLFKLNLKLNLKKQGAYIISVTSGLFKASSLLLISDIAITSQANQNEIFVYSKNLLKEVSASSSKVFISNGKKIILKNKTNNNGVLHYQFSKKEKKLNLNNLKILVNKNGHYAGTELSTSNLIKSYKTEFLGYIYSDKPIYKPGDRLAYKAIVRLKQNGILKKIKYNSFLIKIISPSGQEIYKKILSQNTYGTISGQLILAKTINIGYIKLIIQNLKNRSIVFKKRIEIAKYTKPEKEIIFETNKIVYYPRDIVKLKIIGKHLFGLTANNKNVFYKIENENYISKKLNNNGILNISIPTVRYGSKTKIRVQAYIEGGKKVFSKSIPIIIRDFSISLKSKKDIYLPSEKAVVYIKTLNLFNKGLSKKLNAKLFIIENQKEKLILEKPLETQLGKAKIELNINKGGIYNLLIEGIGYNNIPVRRQIKLRILNKKEKDKLFILSENKVFNTSKKVNINLYSKGKSGLVLLILKGKTIIKYKVIKIKAGNNNINLKLNKNLVPNFKLCATLLKPENTYYTDKQFNTDHKININIKTNKKVYKPNDILNLSLKTYKLNNKGIISESSVALIDEGVLLIAKTKIKNIKSYFYRKHKYPKHSYGHSTPYKYLSKTIKISKEIKKEMDDISFKKKTRRLMAKNGGPKQSFKYKPSKSRPTAAYDKIEPTIRKLFPDIAFFKSRIITNKNGIAKIKVKLPKTNTKWRIIVISSSKDHRFGIAQKTIIARKNFITHIETPSELVQGDKLSIDGNLINASNSQLKGDLKININQNTNIYKFSIKPKESYPFESKEFIANNKDNPIRIIGISPYDSQERLIPVRKWGSYFYKEVRGYVKTKKTQWINIKNLTTKHSNFKLIIYSALNKALFQVDRMFDNSNFLFQNHIASHLIAKLSLLKYLNLYESNRLSQINNVEREIIEKINFLSSTIKQNGGWSWVYNRGKDDLIISSLVYYALSKAKNIGFKLKQSILNRASKYLNNAFYKLTRNDLENKVLILYALSSNNKASYPYVNRLYRNRHKLSLRGLNLLSLTLHNMNRNAEALELLVIIKNKIKNNGFNNKKTYLDFLGSKSEVIALSMLSFLKLKKYTFKSKPYLVKLFHNLNKLKYVSQEFLALFSECISTYLIHQKPYKTNFNLKIKWNNKTIINKKITGINPPKTININKNIKNKNKLEISIKGKGEIFYSGVLSHFQPIVREKLTKYGSLTKTIKYPKYSINSKPFSRGYSTIEREYYSYTVQELKNTAQHIIFPVSIRLYLNSNIKESYFIMEDNIPAGCTFVQDTVSGQYSYYRKDKNKLIFYIKRRSPKQRYIYINYKLISRFRGHYKTLPTQVYPISNYNKIILGKVKKLSILNPDYNTFKSYNLSPDELYTIGKYYFEHNNYKKSKDLLNKVFTKHRLRDKYYKESCVMLLYISLANNNHNEVVKFFELLKERYPKLIIPFEKVLKIADSYHNIKEDERAIQVLNGTIKSYFLQEVAIPGTLSSLNKVLEAYNLINQLIKDYPDYKLVLKTYYTFAQNIYLRYTELKSKKVKKLKPNMLFTMAKNIFQTYLIYYPESYNADEVAFTLLNLYLDHKNYKQTINKALLYSRRYKNSRFLDGYKFIAAHALFKKGDYLKARNFAKSVSYDLFPGELNLKKESDNKYFAILMLAKIYHYQKKFIKALREYNKVKNKFVEAKRSIEFIKEKKILLKEVTQIKEKEISKIDLTFKGLKNVMLKLYKVNFTILALKQKDLTKVTKINLSGIKPFFQRKYSLSRYIPHTPIKTSIKLPIKKVGAYLLVFKSDEVQGSGIILKSNLTLDVIEKTISGRVRITVLDNKNRFVKGVNIRFIGSKKGQYKRAVTDLRGSAETDNLSNIALVVGEKNNHYCFYRGKYPIIKSPIKPKTELKIRKPIMINELGSISKKRSAIQRSNRAYWQNQYEREEDVKGVEVQTIK